MPRRKLCHGPFVDRDWHDTVAATSDSNETLLAPMLAPKKRRRLLGLMKVDRRRMASLGPLPTPQRCPNSGSLSWSSSIKGWPTSNAVTRAAYHDPRPSEASF